MNNILNELRAIGLSEKESRVYLAALQLGPATVQVIAEKSEVNRATTYVMIESLIDRGLMGTTKQGKKSIYIAESPKNIEAILAKEREQLEVKQKSLAIVLDELKGLSESHHHPKVIFYEGEKGVERIRDMIRRSKVKELFEFSSLDDAYKYFPPSENDHRPRLRKGRKIKFIYASQSGIVLPAKEGNVERRNIPFEKYPFEGDVVVYGKNVGILNYSPKMIGVHIENEGIATTFRQLFKLAWDKK